MLHFLLGSAVIVLPRGNLALLAAIGAVKGAGESDSCCQPGTAPPTRAKPHLFLCCRRFAAGALKRKLSNKSSGDDGSKQQPEQDEPEQQAVGAKRASTPGPTETVRPARGVSAAAQLQLHNPPHWACMSLVLAA